VSVPVAVHSRNGAARRVWQRGWERRRAAAELIVAGVAVAVREVVQVPVTLRPERSEWVGELAELTRQIAALELPDGCLHPVYEALTVAINQLVHRNRTGYAGHHYSFTPHPRWSAGNASSPTNSTPPPAAHRQRRTGWTPPTTALNAAPKPG